MCNSMQSLEFVPCHLELAILSRKFRTYWACAIKCFWILAFFNRIHLKFPTSGSSPGYRYKASKTSNLLRFSRFFRIAPLETCHRRHEYDETSQHSKWMDNLNVDSSSGLILSCFFGCEGKTQKTKQWINQACKAIHTATLGMKLTSLVCEIEIKINISKSKVKLQPYSKSISTTKCVISPLFKINMHHQMWNHATPPNRYAPPARTWTRGLQHVNWVCRPLHHQSLTLSS